MIRGRQQEEEEEEEEEEESAYLQYWSLGDVCF